MKVKVCGMRIPENIEQLAHLRIDLIGLIFYEKSPRFVEAAGFNAALANPILDITSLQEIPKVGVFVDADPDYILEKSSQYNLSYLQLHGSENVFYCQNLKKQGQRLIKVFSVTEHFNFTITEAYDHLCEYFIFDTKGDLPGGNGYPFNWEILKHYRGQTPFLLSGGIGPESVKALQNFKHPKWAGIDINSRFETSPGDKNIEQIRHFLQNLREARILKTELPNWD